MTKWLVKDELEFDKNWVKVSTTEGNGIAYFQRGRVPFIMMMTGEEEMDEDIVMFAMAGMINDYANNGKERVSNEWCKEVAKGEKKKLSVSWIIQEDERFMAEWSLYGEFYKTKIKVNDRWKLPRSWEEQLVYGIEGTKKVGYLSWWTKKEGVEGGRSKMMDYQIEVGALTEYAYQESPTVITIRPTMGDLFERSLKENARKLGWEKDSNGEMVARILTMKNMGFIYGVGAALQLAKVTECVNQLIKDGFVNMEETEGLYGEPLQSRGGTKVLARYERDTKKGLIQKLSQLTVVGIESMLAKVTINAERLDSGRKREFVSMVNGAGWNVSMWGDTRVEFLTQLEKGHAFDEAKKLIELATDGRLVSRKLDDADVKPREIREEEAKADLKRLEEIMGKIERKESFRKYLLAQLKTLEEAVKKMEKGDKNDNERMEQ